MLRHVYLYHQSEVITASDGDDDDGIEAVKLGMVRRQDNITHSFRARQPFHMHGNNHGLLQAENMVCRNRGP